MSRARVTIWSFGRRAFRATWGGGSKASVEPSAKTATAIRILSRWLRDGLLVEDGDRLVFIDWEEVSALADGEA
jgi:hypothetical protein